MAILYRDFYNVTRGDTYTIVPLGDVHLGNAACDEKLFKSVVQRIADDPNCYWVSLGDVAEFINLHDKRFDPAELASWVKVAHLADIAKAQRDRYVEFVAPIAGKCLAMVEGNHERTIKTVWERDIYLESVQGVKEKGGFAADHNLALGYAGWLILRFYRSEKRERATFLKLYLHHGFGGGRLAGGKALNMQRWLWTHDADLVLFGHTHDAQTQVAAVESVSGSRTVSQHRKGVYCGTFLGGAAYAVNSGYLPLPITYVEVQLKPGAEESRDRVKVIS